MTESPTRITPPNVHPECANVPRIDGDPDVRLASVPDDLEVVDGG